MNITYNSIFSQGPFKNISLSPQCIQIILGSVLGDGSLKIQKNYKNARFQIRHSILQEEYMLWKFAQLKEIALPTLKYQKADGFSKNAKIGLQSRALSELTKIHAILCVNNTLNLRRDWLDSLNSTALLVWWLDDGSLINNGRRGCFCTDSFIFSDQKILKEYLFQVWGIKVTIGGVTVKKTFPKKDEIHYRLYLSNTSLRRLFSYIMPKFEIASMFEKFALRYKDLEKQKRWITTMKESMPNFDKEIDELYARV